MKLQLHEILNEYVDALSMGQVIPTEVVLARYVLTPKERDELAELLNVARMIRMAESLQEDGDAIDLTIPPDALNNAALKVEEEYKREFELTVLKTNNQNQKGNEVAATAATSEILIQQVLTDVFDMDTIANELAENIRSNEASSLPNVNPASSDPISSDMLPNTLSDTVARGTMVVGLGGQRRIKLGPDPQASLEQACANWLRHVGRRKEVSERLKYFGHAMMTSDELPDYRRTLACALASEMLEAEEFEFYARLKSYRYWIEEQERLDLAEVNSRVWDLPKVVLPSIALCWYRHVLRNAPVAIDFKASSFDEANEEMVLEGITRGKIRVILLDQLNDVGGVLFTGPRIATIVAERQDEGENEMAAHLLAHYLHSHVDRRRFGMRLEPRLVNGERQIDPSMGVAYARAEREANATQICLTRSDPSDPNLTAMGNKLVAAFLQEGVPKPVVRILFTLRALSHMSFMTILSKPFSLIKEAAVRTAGRAGISPTSHIKPGDLVRDGVQHLYFIDQQGRKRDLQDDQIISLCGWDVYKCNRPLPHRISDRQLAALREGDPITSIEEAIAIGVCGTCSPYSGGSPERQGNGKAKERSKLIPWKVMSEKRFTRIVTTDGLGEPDVSTNQRA